MESFGLTFLSDKALVVKLVLYRRYWLLDFYSYEVWFLNWNGYGIILHAAIEKIMSAIHVIIKCLKY